VEAIFLYNAAMRDEMMPRKAMPHPEQRDQQVAPLKDVFLGGVPEQK
jgi:carboxypeptidase Q